MLTLGFITTSNAQETEPIKIESNYFDNLYKVSETVYRSEQPNRKGMQELEELGLKTIINLRNRINDNHEVRETDLIPKRIPINSWKFEYNDIVETLKVIENSEKPVLIHCLHGSDRTGAMVAAYRMVYQNWSKDDAIAEFLEPRFGYHEKWFPEIPKILKGLDIEQLKMDIQTN